MQNQNTGNNQELKLYYVKRYDVEYDEFEAFICAASSEKEARETHPSGLLSLEIDKDGDVSWYRSNMLEWDHQWTTDIEELKVECIGTFNGTNAQVIMTRFFNG
jgi:hypothetical protein